MGTLGGEESPLEMINRKVRRIDEGGQEKVGHDLCRPGTACGALALLELL